MAKRVFVLVTTLTWSLVSQGAPHEVNPDQDPTTSQAAAEEPYESLDTLNLTEAPAVPRKTIVETQAEAFYPYQAGISPRAGLLYESPGRDGIPLHYIVGFQYMADSPSHKHWEYGADAVSNGTGFAHAAKKWIYRHQSSFRPFVKMGLSLRILPEERLAAILRLQNYQVRFCTGFEKTLSDPVSVRVDLEAAAGTGGVTLAMTAGYTWAW